MPPNTIVTNIPSIYNAATNEAESEKELVTQCCPNNTAHIYT